MSTPSAGWSGPGKTGAPLLPSSSRRRPRTTIQARLIVHDPVECRGAAKLPIPRSIERARTCQRNTLPAIQIDGLFLLFSHLDPATFRLARKSRKYNRAISVDGGVVVCGGKRGRCQVRGWCERGRFAVDRVVMRACQADGGPRAGGEARPRRRALLPAGPGQGNNCSAARTGATWRASRESLARQA